LSALGFNAVPARLLSAVQIGELRWSKFNVVKHNSGEVSAELLAKAKHKKTGGLAGFRGVHNAS
jgi:hypothetical protein